MLPHNQAGRSMAHDMSDPAMGASMEADLRRRFWVALALSAVILFLSPMGRMFGVHLPFSPAAGSWTLLALTTPVVFWCGWMFISGAYQALRSRKLDMSVLIAVGVLAAYLASRLPDRNRLERHVLRCRHDARDLRPLRTLDGDEIAARHVGLPEGTVRSRSA